MLDQIQLPPPRQDCSRCRHIFKCRNRKTAHGKPLSDRNDTINLLVCRLKMGINSNESAKTLLQLYRPGMVNLVAAAKRYAGSFNIDFDVMLMDMQSFTIEAIITKYRIGDLNPITNFLFDIKSGYLTKWSQWYVTKSKRFALRHTLAGANPYMDSDENDEYEFVDNSSGESGHDGTEFGSCGGYGVIDAARTAALDAAIDDFHNKDRHSLADDATEIIENGVTLNANEYRVFKFCLQNANDNNDIRMIDGLHIHLAKIMGVSRPRVTRLYARGRTKIQNAMLRKRYQHE